MVIFLPTRATWSGERARFVGLFQGCTGLCDGWMLARAPASTAQGLHHHGPRYFIFPYFCTMCSLEKLGIVDKKTGWNVFVRFVAENAGRG